MKVITDPINKVPDITELDIDRKAVLTVMSRYLRSNKIVYIGVADRIDDYLVRWLGYCANTTHTDPDDLPLSEWYVEKYLIGLLLVDKRTYGPDVYFLILETEQDLINFQKEFPNLNINMLETIREKLRSTKNYLNANH